jgi:hypothetical protein
MVMRYDPQKISPVRLYSKEECSEFALLQRRVNVIHVLSHPGPGISTMVITISRLIQKTQQIQGRRFFPGIAFSGKTHGYPQNTAVNT